MAAPRSRTLLLAVLVTALPLEVTRTFVVSPFPEDRGRVPFFGGCDRPFVGNRTASICRARLPVGPVAPVFQAASSAGPADR